MGHTERERERGIRLEYDSMATLENYGSFLPNPKRKSFST